MCADCGCFTEREGRGQGGGASARRSLNVMGVPKRGDNRCRNGKACQKHPREQAGERLGVGWRVLSLMRNSEDYSLRYGRLIGRQGDLRRTRGRR